MNTRELSEIVSDELGLDDIKKKTRKKVYVYGRAIAASVAKDILNIHPENIAEGLNVDRCSVLHYLSKVFPEIESYEPSLYESYLNIKSKLAKRRCSKDQLEMIELLSHLTNEEILTIKEFINNDYNIQEHQGNIDTVPQGHRVRL